jgi:hypothetical protein
MFGEKNVFSQKYDEIRSFAGTDPYFKWTSGYGPVIQDLDLVTTMIKKKIKFFSYLRKFRMKQLQRHM